MITQLPCKFNSVAEARKIWTLKPIFFSSREHGVRAWHRKFPAGYIYRQATLYAFGKPPICVLGLKMETGLGKVCEFLCQGHRVIRTGAHCSNCSAPSAGAYKRTLLSMSNKKQFSMFIRDHKHAPKNTLNPESFKMIHTKY